MPLKLTPAFTQWFGDSKVVDADGKPLVVYHGTNADFKVFRHGDIGFHFGPKSTSQTRLENQRASKNMTDKDMNIMSVYLKIKNPLRMPDVGDWENSDAVANRLGDMMVDDQLDSDKWEAATANIQGNDQLKIIRQSLEAMGYDGIVYDNVAEGGGDSYIVFDPTQIKSATGNNGNFDAASPDIRFSMADQDIIQGTPRTENESMGKPNHVRAARQIVNAIEQDGNSADYALRVIPAEFKGAIQVGDVLPVSRQWVNGDETKTNLEGTSAARILNADEKSVVDALRNLGANGKDGANGYYFGSRVVLIKGDSMGSGEDVGEVVIKGAEVVGMWNKPTNGSSEVMPNTDAGDISQSTVRQKIDHNIKLSTSRDQTEMPAFRKWFGNSQVVNGDGTPMVVYHGSASSTITRFKPGVDGAGWFAKDSALAGNFAAEGSLRGGTVYPVYLALKNPLDTRKGWPEKERQAVLSSDESNAVILARMGYDGLISDEYGGQYGEAGTTYLAFCPEQIKSAIGNNGNFDAANPDIRFSMADVNEVEDEAENGTEAPCP